jgi:hypothetical protein
MPEMVYTLCFLTSAAVAFLLLPGYRRTRTALLLWSGLGFLGLCLNNILLVLDLVIFPTIDLSIYRAATATLGLLLLVFGLLWTDLGNRGPNHDDLHIRDQRGALRGCGRDVPQPIILLRPRSVARAART